jgi:DNA-binding transcriptional LysR family regulator
MSRKIDADSQIGRRLRLRDLHLFFTVVHAGSMAKAAAQLGISQPSVSEVIAGLERALGVRLFDRSSHGVEPTVYGHALLKRGLAAFDELKQGIRDIEFLADPAAGELKIGCTEPVAAIFTPIIKTFLREYPRVTVHVAQVENRTLDLPILRNRECDLVLGHFSTPLLDNPLVDDLNVEVLFNDRLVVAAGSHSRWSRRRKIDLAELVDEPWILSQPNSWNYRIVLEAFRACGLNMPRIRLVTYSAHLRADMITSGEFIATFPNSIVRLFASRLAVKVLPVNLPVRPWPMAVVTLKNRTLSPVVEEFIKHLRNFTRPMQTYEPTVARQIIKTGDHIGSGRRKP